MSYRSSLALIVTAWASVPAGAQEPVTAFVNVSVVPMDRERVLTGQTVLARGSKIVALGPSSTIEVPAEAVRVDGKGKYLMPGLADMHAHVPLFPRAVRWVLHGTPPFDSGGMAEAERMLLLNVVKGVTTVRLMYGWPETLALRERAAKGELLSPRIYTASMPLYPLDGFVQPAHLGTPEDAVDFVTRAKAAGYDFIKMYGINGEMLDTVAAAAKRAGILIAGHVPGGVDGLAEAIRVGYRSIEHLWGFPEYLLGNTEWSDAEVNGWPVALPLDTAKLRSLAVAIARAGVWSCPTLILWEFGTTPVDSIKQLPERRYVDHDMYADTIASFDTMSQASRAARLADAHAVATARRTIVKALHDAGAGLLLGTDAQGGFLLPGFAAHRELQALVRAGLTPYEALLTGTRNAAAYFGTLDSAGTVAVGKRADLVLLDANPLELIEHTQEIAGVMLGGQWLSRAELDRRLKTLEQDNP